MDRVVVGGDLGPGGLEELAVAHRSVADEPEPFDLELLGAHHRRPEREDLAAARIDHRDAARERLERRDARRGDAERERQPARGGEPDPDRGEAAGPGPDDERVDPGGRDPRRRP